MNTVTVTSTELIVEPQGLDKLWGLKRELRFPLSHVLGATADDGVAADPRGLRAPGLSIGGKTVGTFHRDGEAVFWSVDDPRSNVVIQLRDERLARVVVTVQDPAATERAVTEAPLR